MSVVTNLIFVFGTLEEQEVRIREVNQYFREGEKGLISVDDSSLLKGWYGGTKMLEVYVFIGAFNFFDIDNFMKHIRTIKWESPEEVQCIFKEQEEYKFRIIDLVEESRMQKLYKLLRRD